MINLREPPMFRVVYINDNVTTQEFVVQSLIEHFDYKWETAEQITIDIHETGSACVAVLPFEIAEQKGTEVTIAARQQSYPCRSNWNPKVFSDLSQCARDCKPIVTIGCLRDPCNC